MPTAAPRNLVVAVLAGARGVLLAGPAAVAFFSGGYFAVGRDWAGLGAWALTGLAALAGRGTLGGTRAARLALAGLGLLGAWTLLSSAWSPLAGTAYGDGQRVILYLGVALAATSLLRGRAVADLEPAVVAGTLVVIGYGLSERLLPALLSFQHSVSAQGRLEQPLTYWNAMGAVAAIGLVLSAHLAGRPERPAPIRLGAVIAAAPLGLGLYCSFSRGALFACVAGLLALIVLAPTYGGLRGIGLTLGAAVAASLSGAFFPGVTSLSGRHNARVTEGAVTLALLAGIALAGVLAQRSVLGRERAGRLRDRALPLPRHAGGLATGIVIACFGAFLLLGAKESSGAHLSGGAARLTSLESSRYSYWQVAWRAFTAEPVHGVGGGGWAVYWLRYRHLRSGAQDAHSLYIQTAAELGLVGLALLAAFLAALALAAREALARAPATAAGPTAGLVVWAMHCAVDWDWEMPAVTLVAMLLVGGLLSRCELLGRAPESATALP